MCARLCVSMRTCMHVCKNHELGGLRTGLGLRETSEHRCPLLSLTKHALGASSCAVIEKRVEGSLVCICS